MIREILDGGTCIEVCNSKRNKVSIVSGMDGQQYVLKEMRSLEYLDNEVKVLQRLYSNGVAVPRIIEIQDTYLLLEYIPGKLYLEKFERMELDNMEQQRGLVLLLLDYLEKFYRTMKLGEGKQVVLGDVNFRNFICHQEMIYGIDMELCNYGKIEEDLGKIAAFARMYHPEDTKWKQCYVEQFIEECMKRFTVSRREIEDYYMKELEQIKIRRAR